MLKKIIKLILIVLWMGVIFVFSADNGDESNKKSDGVILSVLKVFYGNELSENEKETLIKNFVVPVRKLAHFGVYFVLGILVLSFVMEYMKLDYKAMLISIGMAFLYACSDEIHQLFVVGRSGRLLDVFIDTIGATIGVAIFTFIVRKCSRSEQKERIS